MSDQYTLPGRLGNDSMTLATDPRTNPKLQPTFKTLGFAQNLPPTKLSSSASLEQIKRMASKSESMVASLYEMLPNDLPGDQSRPKVERKDVSVNGVDGNDVKLHVFRQAGTEAEKRPCVVYIHGGGMVNIPTINPTHVAWCTDLALAGVVAIAIDFRNAFMPEDKGGAHNPFPAGLNDCAAGVQYIASHKSELNISSLVLTGESGGANLSIATTIKAKREGWVNSIDGVFGLCPYISCAWGWPKERRLKELPSTVENDGYFLETSGMVCMAHYYSPNEADKTNPLAWPYYATTEDLKGLPPHVLVMDELDPLRDEGIAFGRKLVAAGVSVSSSVNLGVTHGASLIFRQALPEVHYTAVNSIAAFARSLAKVGPAKL